jgi:hypothetical protein
VGGLLSTRWARHRKKVTVEACRVLEIHQWTRTRLLQANVRHAGAWSWVDGTNVPIATLGYVVDTTDMATPTLTLSYTLLPARAYILYAIPLATTPVHRGGMRWWFCCPLVSAGEVCHRRCEKLYLPPAGQRYFGCRQCYDLAYLSTQESHKYDTLAKHMKLPSVQVRQALVGTG